MSQLTDLFSNTQIQIIAILIGVDVILGIIAAIVKKDFRFGKVGKFMHAGVLTYVLGFGILRAVGTAFPQLGFAVQIAFFLIIVAIAASLIRNLNKLGLSLPGVEKM